MPGRSLLGVAALLGALGAGWYLRDSIGTAAPAEQGPAAAQSPETTDDPVQDAFRSRASGRMMTITGTVQRILADDRDGSPHQRFIIATVSGLTLMVAHNLDLAPRLEGLKAGDSVTVAGEYEWNDKGGLMHWTHDDPQGRHRAGYIQWRDRRYQ
jgi:hypothetical protein